MFRQTCHTWCRRLRRLSRHRIHRKCPSLYDIYRSTPSEYRIIKAIIGFPIGAFLGVAFHLAVIRRLRIPEFAQYGISGVFLASLAVGFAASAPARCIILLILPTFLGKSGRSYIGTFALAYLLSGPVANIVNNGQEITRSVRCSMEVAANLTESRMNLRFRPMAEIMRDLAAQGSKMQSITEEVKKQFLPVATEVEDDSEVEELRADNDYVDNLSQGGTLRSDKIEERHRSQQTDTAGEEKSNTYERKLDYRCEDIFSIGVKNCRKAFMDAEAQCMKKLSVLGHALCLPLKLTVICELVRLAPGLMGLPCVASNAVNDGFGDSYQTALDAADDLNKNFQVNMQYKVVKADEDVDMVTANEVSQAVAYEFDNRRVWVNFTLDLINTLMTFLFMRVIFSSYKYHQKYVSDFSYDNTYITAYFRHIDLRRRKQRKRTLLPLKKTERKAVIFPLSRSMTAAEVKKLISRSIRLLMEVFTYTLIILIDRAIYECLDIIQRHSRIDFKQTGSHVIALEIYGKGVMGNLLRTLLQGFNKKHAINDLSSNAPCLPHPTMVANVYLIKIGVVFIIKWGLVVAEAYMMRLRSLTACLFYPKREKKRVLYLYNGMLKRRKGFLRHTRHQVRRNARERRLRTKTSMLTALSQQFPRICWCLHKLKLGRRKCLVCEEGEKGKGKKFVTCETPGCRFVYCKECWVDVHKKCYACRGAHEWSSESSSD